MQPKDDNNQEQNKNGFLDLKTWEIIVAGILIFFILFGPLILTSYSWFDFTTTGEIGDTIGGITAPFVNLLAAGLVYKSFEAQYRANQEQIKANKIQQDSHEEQMSAIRQEQFLNSLIHLFDEIEKDIHSKEGSNEDVHNSFFLINSLSKYNFTPEGRTPEEKVFYLQVDFQSKIYLIKQNVANLCRLAGLLKFYLNKYGDQIMNIGFIEFYTKKIEELKFIYGYETVKEFGSVVSKFNNENRIAYFDFATKMSMLEDDLNYLREHLTVKKIEVGIE